MTDLTPPEHSHSEAVIVAAQWLADQAQSPSPIVPALRQRFGLSAVEATETVALAAKYRIFRKVHR
ncbi:hypothetical protein MRS76_24380 [Rhizobiaceae bacterium n13]|uniref:hypothetical protein n=1 Tax=Ferirhizobium litorale TaxID=2927786 RepID=UPI0024B28F9B|nr:hypothetical protein [Fererhizobium litorale]MDI7865058.1 hypothetical protein [Fererhizobium litorale]